MEHLPEGASAPDFELETTVGGSRRLSDLTEAGPVLLAFYKISCPTSQMTFPHIQKLIDESLPGSRPAVWGVSQDELEHTLQFSEEFGIRFPSLIDEHPYTVSSEYALSFVPTIYLIDRQGSVQIADFGFSKPALQRAAEYFAADRGVPPPQLFSPDDGLPERYPG